MTTAPTTSRRRRPTLPARMRGAAMLMVMIALAVGAVITLSFLSAQTTSTAIAYNANRQVQARAIAEDGLSLALEHLRGDTDIAWRDNHTHGVWTSKEDLNGGTFRVLFEDEDDADLSDDVSDVFLITVEGSFNGIVHRITNRVQPTGATAPLTVLLVVGSSTMSDQDLAKAALFESWGYTVVTVIDSDSQATFDAAAAGADVAYVSEECSSSDVGTKLNGHPFGIVNEEAQLFDELGMATSRSYYTGDTIRIADNTHPITSGLPIGDVQIASSLTSFVALSPGYEASGAALLATHSTSTGYTVVSALDVGDTMTDGNPAPNRRVCLPAGGDSFDINALNANGHTLLQQAIEWAAAGPTVTSVAPISRWTLNETAGSLATDTVGGHNGTYSSSGTTLAQSGQIDTAVELNGSNGYVEIAHHDDFLVDEGAISLWVYLDDLSGRQELFSKDSSGYDTGGHITIHANGDDVELRFQSTGNSYSLDSGSLLSVSTWHHVAFTFGPAGMRLYVDGSLVDSDSYTGGLGTSSGGVGNYEPIALGANTWSSGNLTVSPLNYYLHGRLDDVRIYDQQLSAAQVSAVFIDSEAATSEEGGATPSLVALYEFIEPNPVAPQLVSHWALNEQGGTLSGPEGGAIAASDIVELKAGSIIDSYDSSVGPYGGSNISSQAVVSTNRTSSNKLTSSGGGEVRGDAYAGPGGSASSVITATVTGDKLNLDSAVDFTAPTWPTGLPSNQGDVDIQSSQTWSTDRRYDKLVIKDESTITISGNVTLYVNDEMTVEEESRVVIPSGSSLTVYIDDKLEVKGESEFNSDSSAAGRLQAFVTGSGSSADIKIDDESIMAGDVYVRDDFELKNESRFFGRVRAGDDIKLDDDSQLHLDLSLAGGGGVTAAADEMGVSTGSVSGGVTGGATGTVDDAFEFDGNDGMVEVPHTASYLIDQGTLAFWFRPGDTSGTQTMVSKDASSYVTGGHFRVYLDGARVECRLQSTSASYYVKSSSSAISAGAWHHVAVGFGPGGLRMYLDGALVDTDSYTGGLGVSSGGVGNEEPWAFGVDTWQSSSGSTNGWQLPYHGRLDDIRLYDQNLNADQAADLYAQTDPRAVVPAVVYDTAGESPAHDLAIADADHVTWISGGGLTIDTGTTISSGGTVTRLHDAITASDAVTVEAIFTPANITQDGPARIVSYSNGTSNRNFHLGQTDAKYNVRLRTEFKSSGTPEAESGDVLVADTREHVIFTYDNTNEELRIYRNGTLEVTETWTGDLDNWNSGYELLLANEASDNRDWLGSLHRVAIYDGTFNGIQADNVFNGDPPGDGTGGEEGLAYEVEWIESP
ncbi:MAG: LamG-like jellyroll fold domain-containing protein [Planctomycetota bacterium]